VQTVTKTGLVVFAGSITSGARYRWFDHFYVSDAAARLTGNPFSNARCPTNSTGNKLGSDSVALFLIRHCSSILTEYR
jgi:hypothetical protein